MDRLSINHDLPFLCPSSQPAPFGCVLKVDTRVLQACQALGVSEEKSVPAAVLAKRLQGLGIAWHSFSLEECQVTTHIPNGTGTHELNKRLSKCSQIHPRNTNKIQLRVKYRTLILVGHRTGKLEIGAVLDHCENVRARACFATSMPLSRGAV